MYCKHILLKIKKHSFKKIENTKYFFYIYQEYYKHIHIQYFLIFSAIFLMYVYISRLYLVLF